jgi:CDGSH-type Zn-finger protein/truncated hemoglobin YjbI
MLKPSTAEPSAARITISENGPYQVWGEIAIKDTKGNVLQTTGNHCLCRCGGSRNKPFCDATHGLKGFVGTETAGHSLIAERRASYKTGGGLTVYDDRSRCAHFGQCTDRLPAVFRAAAEPFVDASAAPLATVADVVSGCPSGALAYALNDNPEVVEKHEAASITPIIDGPYRVRGAIEFIGADGVAYERRERQALCRCGQSRNKPFCDGSHWYAGFRDPLPPELVTKLPTLYEWAGGTPALERLTQIFYDNIFSEPDPILEPVFRGMNANHAKHVAAWLAETFGGPQKYTNEHGGYEHMLAKHRNLALTETQRQRWISRMAATADEAGLPNDPNFRSTFVAYLEWGTRIAVFNSQKDAEVIEHAPIPRWGWGQTPPFEPQQWDAPDAAERGRDRYAQEQANKTIV